MTDIRDADFEANLSFIATDQGGRKTPCRSTVTGYRPNCDFGFRSEDGEILYNDVMLHFTDKEWVLPGDTTVAQGRFLRPDLQLGRLFPGFKFGVHEGQRLVARGVITQIINSQLSNKDAGSPK